MVEGIVPVNNDNYTEFMAQDRAVLVVGASWCGACAVYDELTLSKVVPVYKGLVAFGELLIDKGYVGEFKRAHPDLEEWGIPATILIKNGEEVGKFEGAYGAATLSEQLVEYFVL